MRSFSRESSFSSPRVRIIGLLIAAVLAFFTLSLWRMQVLQGETYARMARTNRVRFVRIPAPRGRIHDRHGAILAENRPGFDVELIPEDVEDREATIGLLGGILGEDPAAVRRKVDAGRPVPYLPVTIAGDVDERTMLAVEERQPMLAGVQIGVYPRRRYVHGALAAHLIGSIGMISPGEYAELEEAGYSRRDLVGKSGLEKTYERRLTGRAGGAGIQVDSRGRLDRVIYRVEPEPGCALFLSIDLETQRAAEAVLEGNKGAVVALDPRNGEVLALASSPAFDPNVFVPPVDSPTVRGIISDPEHALVNRAIMGLYPPGSLMKPLTAFAALERGGVGEETRFSCPGSFTLGRRTYKCWYDRGHGAVGVEEAIERSCNVFFYNAGLKAGRDEMARVASAFGMDAAAGIDLPGEKAGTVPTEAWLRDRGLTAWSGGDTVVMSIGQGYLLMTPLRAALIMGAIANGGTVWRPRAAARIVSPLGETVFRSEPEAAARVPLDPRHLAVVREGLRKAVATRFGTGQKARIDGVEVAGKTGTAQAGTEEARVNHSWFVGYAPFDDPRIVVAVMLEGKASGGFFAAPAARRVIAAHLRVGAEN
ncbi:MAG: penicillin-binding protein 2 [bacterium]|nr:penicillin-binding protein 2 [bacterium]